MTDKDKDHDDARKREAEKREAEKREADKREHEKHDPDKPAARIENRDQDPRDPANKTGAKDMRPGAERDHIEGDVYSSENLMTEQEKDAGNESMGVGPLAQSEETAGPVETMEDLGIGPRTPYPTGDPPPPSEGTTFSQGIKGVTDKPSAKPGSSSGPAGQAPKVGDRAAAYKADHKDDKPKPQPGPMQNQPKFGL